MSRRDLEEYRKEVEAAYHKTQAALIELGAILGRLVPGAPAKRTTLTKREIIKQILEERGPLTIYAIIDEMRTRGFAFSGKNPVNTVRSFIYTCDEFACEKGHFRLLK